MAQHFTAAVVLHVLDVESRPARPAGNDIYWIFVAAVTLRHRVGSNVSSSSKVCSGYVRRRDCGSSAGWGLGLDGNMTSSFTSGNGSDGNSG